MRIYQDLKSILKTTKILSKSEFRNLALIQILLILMSTLEVLSVLSIGPFLTAAIDSNSGASGSALLYVQKVLGIDDREEAIIFLGLICLSIVLFSAIFSAYTIWRINSYSNDVGASLATKLFNSYLHRNFEFHYANDSSSLVNKIANECYRATVGCLVPALQLNAKLFILVGMIMVMIWTSATMAIIGILIFALLYAIIYSTVRPKIHSNGVVLSESQQNRYFLLREGLGGIREIRLRNVENNFVNRFEVQSRRFATATATSASLSQTPRYIVELAAISTIVIGIIVLTSSSSSDLQKLIPALGVFSIAALKSLPAMQQVYSSLTQIAGNIPAISNIENDLRVIQHAEKYEKWRNLDASGYDLKPSVQFKNVTFSYPNAEEPTLRGINLTIKPNQIIGIVGRSGAGKSTILDLILGLNSPTSGAVEVDGQPLRDAVLRSWQGKLGYVPQLFFVGNASISQNIAFGLPKEQICRAAVAQALQVAGLEEFVATLPDGADTLIGEHGVKLSGGQRQRLLIARALYANPDVIIFDEATSSLDGISEEHIMRTVNILSGSKTIIIVAHRVQTLADCDAIYVVENGSIEDVGTYNELLERNAIFQKLSYTSTEYQ